MARNAEPDPGVHVDWLVLGVGAVVFVALAVLSGAFATARILDRARSLRSQARRAPLPGLGHAPPPMGIGIRQALTSGGGGGAVPVRSAMVATGLAAATIVAAATFSSSIDRLLETPRLYGWTHDAQIGSFGLPPLAGSVVDGFRRGHTSASVAAGTVVELDVAGTRVSAFALDDKLGAVRPDLLEGRAARRVDEIVLGTETLDATHAEIGDHVRVRVGEGVVRMRVVGRAVFPDIGDNGQLGSGAQITFAALQKLVPNASSNIVHVVFAPGTDAAAEMRHLEDATTPLPVVESKPPSDLTSFGRVDNLPLFIAGTMLLVAAAVLIHTMVTSIRRRRREFAILETLGWVRRQVGLTVAMQATTFACVALLVGVPLGIAAGRFAWSTVATNLGVPSEPTTDGVVLLVAIVGMLLLANLAAIVPAWLARRARPAVVLRAE